MVPEEYSMSKRKYQSYSREFKLEAIRLAEDSDKPGKFGVEPQLILSTNRGSTPIS
jgi:transposase-like protein